MRIILLTVIVVFLNMNLYSQGNESFNEVNFVNKLGDKKVATVGDAYTFFVLLSENSQKTFLKNQKKLIDLKLIGSSTKEDKVLSKGFLSSIIVRYLKLNDSLMYKITGADRYAFRLCASKGLMKHNGSEYDKISGSELIEIISSMSDNKDGGK